jgi:hypothetical protein
VGPLARAGLGLAVLVLAACGTENAAGPASEPRTEVDVTVWPGGPASDPLTASLTCDPEGGSHPDPAAACRALDEDADALEPVPGDVACTEIYGGPDVARVRGKVNGSVVSASFNRRNGCEIARWEALAPVLALSG